MSGTVFTETYALPSVDLREVLRYAGSQKGDDSLLSLAEDCVKEVGSIGKGKVCYTVLSLPYDEEKPSVFAKSKAMDTYLSACDNAVLFAATVGMEIDRFIARYSRLSPSRAVFMQALGGERIEALCDVFCQDMERKLGKTLLPRFSPGYGDWLLPVQNEIFRLLQPYKRIGLTLNESLLMSPTKSVTAVVGIPRGNREERKETL